MFRKWLRRLLITAVWLPVPVTWAAWLYLWGSGRPLTFTWNHGQTMFVVGRVLHCYQKPSFPRVYELEHGDEPIYVVPRQNLDAASHIILLGKIQWEEEQP